MSFEIVGQHRPWSQPYIFDASGTLALVGSTGHLEITVNNGSGHDLLSAGVDSTVTVVGAVSSGNATSNRKMRY